MKYNAEKNIFYLSLFILYISDDFKIEVMKHC